MSEEMEQQRAATIRHEYIKDRNIDELVGIAHGVLADGKIVEGEVRFIPDWIESHFTEDNINEYPVKTIYNRIEKAAKIREANGGISIVSEEHFIKFL